MANNIDYKLVELSKFEVSGLEIITEPKNAQQDIMNLWSRFMSEDLNIKGILEENPIAVYFNYEGDFTNPYSLLVGKQIKENSTQENLELKTIKIPKQKYAVFEKSGKMPDVVVELWEKIWKTDLNRTYKFDFEKYPDKNKVEIYISID